MKTHITTLNNMAGTASLAHRRVLKVAQSIGCHEMGLSFYPLKPDYAKEIDKRLDGIIAPLNYGDIVIFQYPSWIGVNYDDSFCWRGYFEQEKLMHELSKGGFGLVWSDDEYFDRYYSMNQPYKLGTNLAAGIPVIVKRGCVHEKFVERNGLGYAVDTLDEADKLVQSITDAEYIKLYHNVKNIQKRKIKRIVNQCQKLSVESEEMNRKKSLQYDQVLQRQRDLIYATRKNLLDGASVEQEKIVGIAKENISDFVNHFDCIQSNKKHGRRRGRKKDSDKNTNTQQYTSMLNRYILDNISYKLDAGLSKSDMQSAATVSDYLMLRVYQGLSRQRERIGDEEAYEQFVREATLKAVDDGWVELIDYLEQLKYAVAGRASAQRNVMFEYQNEAFESFLDTEKAVKCNIIRNILLSDVKIGKDGRLQVIYP